MKETKQRVVSCANHPYIQFKLILFSIMACILVIGMQKTTVLAASGSVSTSGGGTYNVGDTISITFSAKADETLYGLQLGISYNDSVLEYISGNGDNGGSGYVSVAISASSSSVSHTIRFKAKGPGSSNVSVTEAIGVADDEFQMNKSSASVTVKAPVTHSSDNNLKSLQISPGTLSPGFSSGTTKYSATVGNSTSKVTVSATPNHSGAKVTSVSGNNNLSVGNNEIKVVVTAEDGSNKTYTINVRREQGASQPTTPPESSGEVEPTGEPEPSVTPTPTPTEAPEVPPIEVSINGTTKYISNDFDEAMLPESFKKESVIIDGDEVNAAVSLDGDLTLLYLVDDASDNGAFYIYDKDSESFSEYIEVEGRGGRYILLPPIEELTIPASYKETQLTIDGKEVSGWHIEGLEDDDFYLVYAMNGSGNKGLYQYDSLEGTFQRFSTELSESISGVPGNINPELTKLQEDLEVSNNEITTLKSKYTTDMDVRFKIIIGLAVLSAILLLLAINLAVKNKFLKEDLLEENDTADWEEEYAATLTSNEEAFHNKSSDKTDYKNNIQKDTNIYSPSQKGSKNVDLGKATEASDIGNSAAEPTINKKKEAEMKDLENASLEDIFEFLKVDELDVDEDDLSES